MNLITNICLSVFFSALAYINKPISDWETINPNEDIKIAYRWVSLGDTLESREIKVFSTFNTSTNTILTAFKKDSIFKEWSPGVEKCSIYTISDSSWITYSQIDFPFPFKNQDMIVEYTLEKKENSIKLNLTPKPNYLKRKSGYERQKDFVGYWLLKPLSKNKTSVTFHSTALKEPRFPRFIQDPIIRNALKNSFNKLKEITK